MTLQASKLLDDKGWRILGELQRDARLSFAELGRRVGLSTPAVAERVRNLEAAGVLAGYRAEIDLKHVGLPILAHLRDTQNYVQAAAHGMTVFDLSASKAVQDWEQWEGLTAWAESA